MSIRSKSATRRGFIRLSGLTVLATVPLLQACGSTTTVAGTTSAATVSAPALASATSSAANVTAATTAGSAATSTAAAATSSATTAASVAATTVPATTAAASAATSSAAGTAAAAGSATLNLYWRSDAPVSFNPLFSTSGSEQQVERLIFGALLKMSDKLVPTPDLADSWEVAPDATSYTFHLHPGIKWSDGQTFSADDVIFTFERAIDKRSGSIWAGRLANIAGAADYATQKAPTVSGLTAPDPNTVKVTLATPDAGFLTTLGSFSGLGILPKHILQGVAPDQLRAHPFSTQAPTVGAGAFTFVTYASGQYVQLKRNDGYFRGKVPLAGIYLKILQPDVALAQLQTGEVDYSIVPVSEMARLKQDANLTISSVVSPSISQIAIFNDRPYFKDKRVRQAMMYAIDRQGIVNSILAGQATLVNSPIIGPEWMGQPEFNKYAFDTAKAKQLLKDANWSASQKITILEPSSPSKEQAAYGAVVQQQLADAGFAISVVQADSAEITKRYVTSPDYDLYDFGGGVYRAEPSISATYYNSKNVTPGGGNGTHYANPALDKLFAQGVATADQTQRKTIYNQIAQIVNDDVPTVFLWSPNTIAAIRKRFQGFKPPSYVDNFLWNAEEWSVSS